VVNPGRIALLIVDAARVYAGGPLHHRATDLVRVMRVDPADGASPREIGAAMIDANLTRIRAWR
jgi:hypothetical protein